LVNDRHPSGTAHDAAYGGYSTTGFTTDPLFGDMPGAGDPYATGSYDTGAYAGSSYDTGAYATGSYDTASSYDAGSSYDTGSHGQVQHPGQWYEPGAGQQEQQHAAMTDPYATSYGMGGYDTGTWVGAGYDQQATGQWETQQGYGGFVPQQGYDAQGFETGSYDTSGLQQQAFGQQPYETQAFETPHFETQGFETQTFKAQAFETQTFDSSVLLQDPGYDTGAYDATAWNSAGADDDAAEAGQPEHAHVPDQFTPDAAEHAEEPNPWEPEGAALADVPRADRADRAAGPAVSRGRAAARRRTPVKRSALLTVAVPSVCAIGVAGVAAASVGGTNLFGGGDDGKDTQAAAATPDVQAVKPSVANNKLDTQLRGLSADAGDFADRASRTQERIDLKAKQEADRKKAAEEAERKEAARPKFALPVKQHGLSAYFGQAGINWMSSHTGIDFPVSYVPVMAATDGTVRTQWNSAYGNMAIVTAKDGTETWYCHLSRHTVLSGPVKAGDVIATSGDSGNSTGPHLHFEVHPAGGAAVDPLPWLRSHGIDPT
jgi:murein DD-endopeptidase MepM/ murein hydrolase activator NlpD